MSAESNLGSLVRQLYTNPESYGDVSARVFGFLHHLHPDLEREGVRQNVMLRWVGRMGRAGFEVLRVTKTARRFFLATGSDRRFISDLRGLCPNFRFLLSPNHTAQLLSFLTYVKDTKCYGPVYLTIRGGDMMVLETDFAYPMQIVAPASISEDDGTLFCCSIHQEFISQAFLNGV
jgi:hypothetical protein